jgi:hypothetical protein
MTPEQYQRRIDKAKLARQRSFERRKNRMLNSKEYKIKDSLNEVRTSNSSGSHTNCFREHCGASPLHEDVKYKVYKYLVRNGHSVITEAIFKNGKGRADVLCLDTATIYEVICSETELELKQKDDYYPKMFTIVCVDSTKEFNEKVLQ